METVTEQQEFVAWLKKHGLYNEFDSAHVMRRMQSVWEQCRVTQQQAMDDLRQTKEGFTRLYEAKGNGSSE